MIDATAVQIALASSQDADEIVSLVGKLLHEIMANTGGQFFNFNAGECAIRCKSFIEEKHYTVFKATVSNELIGVLTLTASSSLYAGGKFGVIQELFVEPGYRSRRVGEMLVDAAKAYGQQQGWVRLEVATPPLPAFDRSLVFYERQNFEVTGGRKMKVLL